jgi:hypothetical protein
MALATIAASAVSEVALGVAVGDMATSPKIWIKTQPSLELESIDLIFSVFASLACNYWLSCFVLIFSNVEIKLHNE